MLQLMCACLLLNVDTVITLQGYDAHSYALSAFSAAHSTLTSLSCFLCLFPAATITALPATGTLWQVSSNYINYGYLPAKDSSRQVAN